MGEPLTENLISKYHTAPAIERLAARYQIRVKDQTDGDRAPSSHRSHGFWFPQSERDVFGFEERIQALNTQFAPPAALFEASEWALAGRGHTVVDADRARFQRFHEAKRARQVARERVCAQPINRSVGPLDGFGLG